MPDIHTLEHPRATPKAQNVKRTEVIRNSWATGLADGVDYREALSREYWLNVADKLRPGDRVEVMSFDYRIQWTMLILDCNTAANPIYLDAAFLPVSPADLELPAMPPM